MKLQKNIHTMVKRNSNGLTILTKGNKDWLRFSSDPDTWPPDVRALLEQRDRVDQEAGQPRACDEVIFLYDSQNVTVGGA
jgi:hypothetical protein